MLDNNELNISAANTESQVHTYCFDWKPDTLTWSVDGSDLRTVNKADTWNTTDNTFHYPQTPARIELSLWPAGLSSNGQGTVDWSGGLVDWNSQYMKNGYYYAMFSDVNVECYDPPAGYNNSGSKSYVYTNTDGLNNSVSITDNIEILGSFYASGENPSFGAQPSGSASSSSSAAPTPSSSDVNTVPGISGGGARGANGAPGGSAGDSGSGTSDQGSGSGSGSGASSAPGAGPTSFSQGTGSSGSSSEGNVVKPWRAEGGSAFAVVVAIVGLMLL